MEKEAGAKNSNSEIRKKIVSLQKTGYMNKNNLLSEFNYCMCHQTYTKGALVLCRLKLPNVELSEICDTIFDQAILTNSNFRILITQNTMYIH